MCLLEVAKRKCDIYTPFSHKTTFWGPIGTWKFADENSFKTTRSAIAEGPRDALSQLESFQLLHKCTKNHIRLEGLPVVGKLGLVPLQSMPVEVIYAILTGPLIILINDADNVEIASVAEQLTK